MSQQLIVNTPQNSGLGDNPFVAANKINANFTELYQSAGNSVFVNAAAYGVDPTGSTDSTAAISAAINAAIANASQGKNTIITFTAGTFLVSGILPNIYVSGIQLWGVGTDDTHNGGSPVGSTTIFKWNGVINSGTMLTIAPAGNAAQYLTGIKVIGITFDCNNGLLGGGLALQSMRATDIDVYVKEAAIAGLSLGCVANLTSDPCDFQFNTIKYKGTQFVSAGVSLVLNGTSTANTSLNVFTYVDIAHKNNVAINCLNCDSNIWLQVRLFAASGGSAIYSWTWQGSNVASSYARSEQIFRLSTTLPCKAIGTGYTYPAGNTSPIKIYNIDKNNSTPDPQMDVAGQIYWQNDTTPIYNAVWTAYTPTVTVGGSGFVSGTVVGQYLQQSKLVTVVIAIPVTTAGTGSGYIQATLPATVYPGAYTMTGAGWDDNIGVQLTAVVQANTTVCNIYKTTTGGYPAVNGSLLVVNITYETA